MDCGGTGGTTEVSGLKKRLKACSRDEVTPEVEVCSLVFNWCEPPISVNDIYHLTPANLVEHRVSEGPPQKAGASRVLSMTWSMILPE